MNRLFFSFAILVFILTSANFAQTPKPTPKTAKNAKTNLTKPKNTKIAGIDKEAFEKARNQVEPTDKLLALQKFIVDFPKSAERFRALEIIVSTRGAIADQKLQMGENEAGVQLFKDAVNDAPTPVSEQLFANVLLQFPTNLFSRGQQIAALQIAQLIETKIKDNPKQLLGLATFYLGVEKPDSARILAESAIALDANMPAAYQTLGLAERLNFNLEGSEKAYTKALEIDANSSVSKRSLAEMKRATGKSDEAIRLYRELIEKDANDGVSQNGLILALFDAGKKAEAEELLGKSLENNPNNLFLLVGAAYWYAAQGNGAKAVELGQKAVEIEPRYTWGRIALARGFMLQKLPLEAEKTLLFAQKYGSFPTLDFELASARFQAGFFEEAARELKKRFAVKDGYVQTYIAGRTPKEAESFNELLGLESRASILTPANIETVEIAENLKKLLTLSQKISDKNSTDEEINQAADDFVKGDDGMKTHRQLYAASRLLEAKKSLPKVLELTQGAIKGVDASLEVANASTAVLADELIESRALAITRDEVIVVPEVPRRTLSNIIRGRIEEITGWTLYQQDKPQEAIVRLKRAVSIMPDKSAWSRSGYWKLGLAYNANGNSQEALNALVKSYVSGQPDRFRRSTIEGIFRKLNGNTEGLDKLIGENPFPETVAQVTETPQPTPIPTVEPTPVIKVETSPTPVPTVEPTPEIKIEPSPTPVPTVEPTPEIKIEPSPTPVPTIEPTPQIKVETSPTPVPTVEPTPQIKVEPSPTPVPTVDSKAANRPLFDTVVITVPRTESKKSDVESEKSAEKPVEKVPEKEQVIETKNEPSAESRQRVVAESGVQEQASCILITQESISILSNGGSLGMLVGLNQEGDVSKITAQPSNPQDISATLEPDIGKESNRLFFLIKSISENKGVFTVTFNSPCGKKEIIVKVR